MVPRGSSSSDPPSFRWHLSALIDWPRNVVCWTRPSRVGDCSRTHLNKQLRRGAMRDKTIEQHERDCVTTSVVWCETCLLTQSTPTRAPGDRGWCLGLVLGEGLRRIAPCLVLAAAWAEAALIISALRQRGNRGASQRTRPSEKLQEPP